VADTNQIDSQKNELQDRLASLGETFNNNKDFGLMGMLAGANDKPSQSSQQLQHIESTVQSNTTSDSGEGAGSTPDWIKAIEPINSSLRAITDTTTRELSSLRNELSSLRQPVVQVQAEAEPADPVAQKFGQIEKTLTQTRLNNAWEKAKNALNAARNQYGKEFDYTEEELQSTWKQHIGNDVGRAEGTNWDMYFKQQYNDRRAPRLEARMKELEAQLERAKQPAGRDVVGDMASMPRGGRNGMPIPSRGPVNDFDEDIYRAASAKMGKRVGAFAGFNRYLVEEQNKRLLRTAS
jgi:hypothetical protein